MARCLPLLHWHGIFYWVFFGLGLQFDSSNDVFHLYSSAGESVSSSEDVYELVIQVSVRMCHHTCHMTP